MSEENNTMVPLPELPSDDDALKQQREEIRPYMLDARERYPEPFYMLEYNGVPFSAIGGIQALSGQKKNGKTFLETILMSAILGSLDSDRVAEYLPGLKVPDRTLEHLGHRPTVLWVDTEMEKLNSAKVLRRVHWLCGWQTDLPCDRFNVMWLRSVTKDEKEPAHVKRLRLIRQAIDVYKPDVVFIDGIRDIIGDFNDNEQSSALVTELMALAEQKQICIWNILHMNPRPGNDDESKMRGHLGTELGNKVTDTLVSVKQKQGSDVTFTVRQQDARGKDMDDFKFQILDDVGKLGIPKIISAASAPVDVKGDDIEDIKRWIKEGETAYEWPMSRADVKKKVFGEIGGQKNHGKQQADLIAAINMKLLQETTIKVSGYPMLMVADELPF